MLDEGILARMRAPPERAAEDVAFADDSSDDEDGGKAAPPGAFPEGSSASFNDSPYY